MFLGALALYAVALALLIIFDRDEDSYQAGYEYGQRHASGVAALSGSKPDNEYGIAATCATAANLAEDNKSGVYWSGGHIAVGDLDTDDYKQGCVDGINDA